MFMLREYLKLYGFSMDNVDCFFLSKRSLEDHQPDDADHGGTVTLEQQPIWPARPSHRPQPATLAAPPQREPRQHSAVYDDGVSVFRRH
jgi:hypothetical protein